MSPKQYQFINRELSWLEFNQRVLNEAFDETVPLLERLNFLSITASNLDEFFMVRVGSLELLVEDGVVKTDPSGLTPAEQLQSVSARTRQMVKDQYSCYMEKLAPALTAAGIRMARNEELTDEQSRHLERFFNEEIFPVLTPMAIDTGAGFPMLTNLKLNIAVRLKPDDPEQKPAFAVIPLGSGLKRLIALPSESGYCYVLVENIVHRFIDRFFPGKAIAESLTFRITRHADFDIRDEMSTDFLSEMEQLVDKRKEGRCIRLETDRPGSKTLLNYLARALKVREECLFEAPGPLNLVDFRELVSLEGFQSLKYEPWEPQVLPDLDPKKSIFDEMKRDILLCHPYDTFDPVVRLLQEAADDRDVLAIKQTLYRTSQNSPIVRALQRAAERGKYVTVIVELKARFDEERNIEWAKALEKSGVQVIYGVRGLKTHAKICIVVRREPQGIVRYLHFGTGNYNERTARIYTDIGLMTRNEDLGADASSFFNAITGYSEPQKFLKLYSAPIGLREKLLSLISSETERKKQGGKAMISAKMNSLVDLDIIKALYEASRAGVKIRLNVRGICCLRPGVKDLSENITVVSIVDRFLEHGRIFYFYEGGAESVFISSADWMPRNLDRRVELMVPVEDKACKARVIGILEACFKDTAKSSRLLSDGSYERLATPGKRKEFRCQEFLHEEACRHVEEAKQAPTVFEPLKPPENT